MRKPMIIICFKNTKEVLPDYVTGYVSLYKSIANEVFYRCSAIFKQLSRKFIAIFGSFQVKSLVHGAND